MASPGKNSLKIRSMVVAPKGYQLMQADYSQGETWIVAHLSNDENMKKFISTGDIHSETGYAVETDGGRNLKGHITCFEHKWKGNDVGGKTCVKCNFQLDKEQRTLGKRSNHGLSYKMSYLRWAQMMNSEGIRISNTRAKQVRDIWLALYPGVPRWWDDVIERLERFNNTLVTTYGRERTFFQHWGDELFKEAIAFEPQSTLADHAGGLVHPELGIKGGFLEVHKQLGNGKPCWIINESHDSILLEVPEKEVGEVGAKVRELLMRPLVIRGETFTIPVDVEVGERWGEMENLKLN